MLPLSRRGVAILATAASLGAASFASPAQAAGTPSSGATATHAQRGLLDGILSPVLAPVLAVITPTSTPQQVQAAVATLPVDQLGSLLSVASPGQLTALLGGLDVAQITTAVGSLTSTGALDGVLNTLTPVQLGDILAPLTGDTLGGALGLLDVAQVTSALATLDIAELTTVVGALSPAQITGLLSSPAAAPDVVAGLLGTAVGLAGGAPSAGAVNGLLAQVQALLANGLPDVAGLGELLATVESLLAVAGLDTSVLTGLLATVNGALGRSPNSPASPQAQNLARSLSGMTGARYTPPKGSAGFTAYRGKVSAIKVAKSRKSARITVSCPASAPKGCLVTLNGVVAGKKAFAQKQVIVLRNAKKAFTVKFTKVAANRLKKKGGSLKVTALTSFSTLAATAKTVKVAKPRKVARKR